MRRVPVGGQYALVDSEDYERVVAFRWHLHTRGYATAKLGPRHRRVAIYMHRLILGAVDPKIQVDHINQDKLDNQKSNLRFATNNQNCKNSTMQKRNTTGYKGVFLDRRNGVFYSHINVDGEARHLGRFKTKEEAAIAYNEAAKIHYGEFACQNILRK